MSEGGRISTYPSAATLDLSGSEGLLARMPAGDAYGVRRVSAATQQPLGVITEVSGDAGSQRVGVVEYGPAKAIAGATFTPTTTRFLMASPSGRVIAFTGLSTNYCIGKLLTTGAVASGNIVDIQVNPLPILS